MIIGLIYFCWRSSNVWILLVGPKYSYSWYNSWNPWCLNSSKVHHWSDLSSTVVQPHELTSSVPGSSNRCGGAWSPVFLLAGKPYPMEDWSSYISQLNPPKPWPETSKLRYGWTRMFVCLERTLCSPWSTGQQKCLRAMKSFCKSLDPWIQPCSRHHAFPGGKVSQIKKWIHIRWCFLIPAIMDSTVYSGFSSTPKCGNCVIGSEIKMNQWWIIITSPSIFSDFLSARVSHLWDLIALSVAIRLAAE